MGLRAQGRWARTCRAVQKPTISAMLLALSTFGVLPPSKPYLHARSQKTPGARERRGSPYHQMARLGRDEAGPQKGWPGGQGFSCASVR